MVIFAPAKVNLFLKVKGRRPDGYTEIDTLFQTVNWLDRVTIEADDRLEVSCDDPRIATDENLGTRAARLFFARVRTPHLARIGIAKTIPVQAGLGGGSSDAAAVLRGLNELFGRPLGPHDLLQMAGDLGSDVPFFIRGGTAVGQGRGERLTWLPDLRPMPMLLVRPACGVPTAEAYRLVEPAVLTGRDSVSSMVYEALARADLAAAARCMSNDLEVGVLSRFPAVRQAKASLVQHGAAVALMSGSGSTCYGLFASDAEAAAAGAAIRREHADWTLQPASFTGQHSS